MCNRFICAAVHLKGKSEKVVEIFFYIQIRFEMLQYYKGRIPLCAPSPPLSLSLYISLQKICSTR